MFVQLRKAIIIVLVSGGLLFYMACDGGIRVKGNVYVRKVSIGTSEAFVDEAFPNSSNLVPVKNATVTLYHGGDYSEQSINKSTPWQVTCKSGPTGGFEVGGTTAPYRFHAALVIEKEGYRSVTKIFLHDKLAPHEALIILEPNEEVAK
jgi:hypothetical protein